MWFAASESRIDAELACDERVIKSLDTNDRMRYANVLVLCASRRNAPGTAILATGMTMTGRRLKTRINSILHQNNVKKRAARIFVAVACLLFVLAFATAEYIPPHDEPTAIPYAQQNENG